MTRTFLHKTGFVFFSASLLATGAILHAACEDVRASHATQKPEDLTDVIAKIDNVTITVGQFQQLINEQSPFVRQRYTSLERRKEFLDNLVRFEVLANEAERRGLNRDPEVVRTMKQVMIQKLLKEEFDKLKLEDISDADCKRYYEAHPEEFNQPEQARVSMILVKDLATAKKVQADARVKGVDNQGYRTLVGEYSIDAATKDRGGDLRYFETNTKEIPHEIVAASFRLQNIGDNSEPVRTQGGYAILKLTGRRKALSRTLEESRQQIRNKIYRDKRTESMENFVKGLREKAKVNIDESKLAKVQIEATPAGAFPGPGVPPPGPGMFHPGAPGAPQATPAGPGTPPGSSGIQLPSQK